MMRTLLALVALLSLAGMAAPATAQSWAWPSSRTPCRRRAARTTNIPVAGASDCPTAITAAQSLFNTYINKPACMTTCPAGQTIHLNPPSCLQQSYLRPNGSTALRWQINQTWTCSGGGDTKRNQLIVKKVIVNPSGADVSAISFPVIAQCGSAQYGFGLNANGGWQHTQVGVSGACSASESQDLPVPANPGKCIKPMALAWVYPATYAQTQSTANGVTTITINITNTLVCKRKGP